MLAARLTVPAVWAYVMRRVALRDDLWNRCHFAGTKAMAADYELAEFVQQAVVNVIVCESSHLRAPVRA